jgi:hypothetical protein
MTPIRVPSREDIHAAYLQGEEAVVVLIEALMAALPAIISQQQEMIAKLEARIQALEGSGCQEQPQQQQTAFERWLEESAQTQLA